MVNGSAQLVTWTAGSGYAQIGTAIEAAASGQVFSVFLGASDPKVLT